MLSRKILHGIGRIFDSTTEAKNLIFQTMFGRAICRYIQQTPPKVNDGSLPNMLREASLERQGGCRGKALRLPESNYFCKCKLYIEEIAQLNEALECLF